MTISFQRNHLLLCTNYLLNETIYTNTKFIFKNILISENGFMLLIIKINLSYNSCKIPSSYYSIIVILKMYINYLYFIMITAINLYYINFIIIIL